MKIEKQINDKKSKDQSNSKDISFTLEKFDDLLIANLKAKEMMKGKSGRLLVGGGEESDEEEINENNLRAFVKKSATFYKEKKE